MAFSAQTDTGFELSMLKNPIQDSSHAHFRRLVILGRQLSVARQNGKGAEVLTSVIKRAMS